MYLEVFSLCKCVGQWITNSGDCADTGKGSGKVLIKEKQMSLGNHASFILVKLKNYDEMIDFVILPVYLFF